jgi:hypothetical protein
MSYTDCHFIFPMSHGHKFSRMQDFCVPECNARHGIEQEFAECHFPQIVVQEGGAATHTNESLSEMLDRLARERSDGLDLDLSERFDKETELPPSPNGTLRIGKAPLCSLSHLYGMVIKALLQHLIARFIHSSF